VLLRNETNQMALSEALNRELSRPARSDVIMVLDHDDIAHPQAAGAATCAVGATSKIKG